MVSGLWHAAVVSSMAFAGGPGAAISPDFTYQGELLVGTAKANGIFDLRFTLFDDHNLSLGTTCLDNVAVVDGRFTVLLNFGIAMPTSPFLEIQAREDTGLDCGSLVGFVTLSPRQRITPAPLASLAQNAFIANIADSATLLNNNNAAFYLNRANHTNPLPSPGLSGNYTQLVNLLNTSNTYNGSGAALTNLNAGNVATGTLSPARGGTGTSVAAATTGQVLKWNGTAFTPQNDNDMGYSIGVGLNLVGNTLSVSSIGSGLLSFDNNSLARVSGNAMSSSGGNIVVNNNLTVNGTLSAGDIAFDVVTRHLTIPGVAFISTQGSGSYSLNGDLQALTAASTFLAPVNLPTGVTVTGLAAFIDDQDAVGNVTVFLLRRDQLDANAGGTMAQVTTSGETSGLQQFTDASISSPVISNLNNLYFLRCDLPAASVLGVSKLRAVRISYNVTSPLP